MSKKFILLLLLIFCKTSAREWEIPIESYFQNSRTTYLEQVRYYTYLSLALKEAEAAPHSHPAIAFHLMARLFPNFVPPAVEKSDPQQIDALLCKYYVRLVQEDNNPCRFQSCWKKPIPRSVAGVAQWIPWTSPLPCAPPPCPYNDAAGWALQIGTLEKMRENLTQEQWNTVLFWAGKHGPGANWRVMALDYMDEKKVEPDKKLLVQAVLMQGLYDGIIAELNNKYFYCVPRPYMKYPRFKPLIKPLRTPSYPSGHAIQGAIFATIMSYFFPEDTAYWQHLNREGANSRMWAGVHFPEDIEQGGILGQKIGLLTLEAIKTCEENLNFEALQEKISAPLFPLTNNFF